MFVFICLCVIVWVMCSVQASVCQKKETHSKSSVCVWERKGGTHSFTLSRWETPLLLLWWWYNLHIPPFSILFFFSSCLPEKQNRGPPDPRSSEEIGENAAPPKAAASTEQQIRALLHRGEAKPAGPRACRSLKWSAASPAMGYLF